MVFKSEFEGSEERLVLSDVICGSTEKFRKASDSRAVGEFHYHGISCRAGITT